MATVGCAPTVRFFLSPYLMLREMFESLFYSRSPFAALPSYSQSLVSFDTDEAIPHTSIIHLAVFFYIFS